MQLSTTLAFSALLVLSSAMPLERRQDITVTSTIDVIETVQAVVTVWLPPGGQPAVQDLHQQVAQPTKPNPAPAVQVTPVQDAVVHTPTSPPAARQDPQQSAQDQANQAQEQKNQAQAAKNQAAQEQSIETQNQVNQAQEQANDDKTAQNQAVPAPVAQSSAAPVSTPAAAPVSTPAAAPVSTPAVAPVASASASPSVTQDNTSSGPTQSTSGGSCGEIGGTCSAPNVTFYGGGLGACGWSNDTNSEDFFALAHDMMGTQSNGNPFCGRTAAIVYNGKTIHGTLTDKCMGCGLQSIDLSQHLYDQLFVESVGNYHDVEWHFTS